MDTKKNTEKFIYFVIYSLSGLKLLSPQLTTLDPLHLSAKEQRVEAVMRAGKMSVQGIQPKLSARLQVKHHHFDIVDQGGLYILKPQSEHYQELPENESLTMSLAATIGIEIPLHGLVYSKDNSLTYFVKRFDRKGRTQKIAIEDFSQLSQLTRDTKYDSSMEKVAKIMTDYCSFPRVDAIQLLKRTLFNFLIGNEDMHLKNFSVITRGEKISLSPAYDLLNTTIALGNAKKEIALPLNGKKRNLNRRDFIEYFANQKLQLNQNIINSVIQEIQRALPSWNTFISHSFLSTPMQEKYLHILEERKQRLAL